MDQQRGFFQEAFRVAPVGMLVVDRSGAIVDVNRQLERLFGYTREELLHQPVELLVDGLPTSHQAQREAFLQKPEPRPMGAGRDLFGRHRDGHRVPVEIGLTPLQNGGVTWVLASVVDLTERVQARQQLQASLTETEILLKELHHRAKNNLQLISSLLDLAAQAPGPEVLDECRDRINSIALVHEKLYQAGTFARIDFRDYLRSLGEQVSHAWAHAQAASIELVLDAQDLSLPLDAAIPCGLVINELLTNAYKHAFPGPKGGTIVLRAALQGTRIELAVEDDGVGLPPGTQAREGHIGLELVHALARQLRGQLTFASERGTRVTLSFEGSP